MPLKLKTIVKTKKFKIYLIYSSLSMMKSRLILNDKKIQNSILIQALIITKTLITPENYIIIGLLQLLTDLKNIKKNNLK